MMQLLVTFAALSMAGTVVLSLLPEGGLKRTAGMAVGLLTLMCWAEGIAELLGVELYTHSPATILTPTTVSVEEAEAAATATLTDLWEVTP